MTLTLVYITDGNITGQETLDCSLFEANQIADLRIEAGAAPFIEIQDEHGTVRSRRPRAEGTDA